MRKKSQLLQSLRDSSREARERSCLTKLTWHTRDEAIAARAYAGWQHGENNLTPYTCRFCGYWHLSRRSYTDE